MVSIVTETAFSFCKVARVVFLSKLCGVGFSPSCLLCDKRHTVFMRSLFVFFAVCVLFLGSSSFAQVSSESNEAVVSQAYAGANVNLVLYFPALAAHVGAKDVFVEDFGVRLGFVTAVPYSFELAGVISLDGLYTFYETSELDVYAGGGPKFVFSTATSPYTIFAFGGVVGAEFAFESFNTFVEIDFLLIPDVAVIIPLVPVLRLGFSIPF